MKLPSTDQRITHGISDYRDARVSELFHDSKVSKAGLARMVSDLETRLIQYSYFSNYHPELLKTEIMSDFSGGIIDDETEAYKKYVKPIEHLIY